MASQPLDESIVSFPTWVYKLALVRVMLHPCKEFYVFYVTCHMDNCDWRRGERGSTHFGGGRGVFGKLM